MDFLMNKLMKSGAALLARAARSTSGSAAMLGVPRQFAPTTSEWFERAVLDRDSTAEASRYQEIEKERLIWRSAPLFCDRNLLPKIEASLQARQKTQFVATLESGRCLGSCFGCVVTQDGTLLEDVSLNIANWCEPVSDWRAHMAFQRIAGLGSSRVNGEVIALNTPFAGNFHHFLLDTVPRVGLCEEAGIDIRGAEGYLLAYNGAAYQQEVLPKLGIDVRRVIPIHKRLNLQALTLHVPSISEPVCREQYIEYTARGMEYVRRKLRPAVNGRRKRRLLLSRRLTSSRRWLDEDAALPELEAMGFERVECERLTVLEQAQLFGEAEAVIMPHGGGMANCVFCEPGTKVFELFHPRYHPVFMVSLSNVLGLDYHAVSGEDTPVARHADTVAGAVDVLLSPKKLVGIIRNFL
jgi:capsular polysaccharide biosynthesis protein